MFEHHSRLLYILRCRYAFLFRTAPQDFRQCVYLGELVEGDAQRNATRELERLAHDLGYRRISERGRRVWVTEFFWLRRAATTRRRVGAPPGNRNAAGHAGRNQYTKEPTDTGGVGSYRPGETQVVSH
ncbi:MAG: hypothetical protein JO110_01700 [Acetobacteraceae bacterium]|nr:hypothetical protein [Acetobacteraceae bacterium]